jgi:hypothetical protein
MSEYRAFVLDRTGHIINRHDLHADSDQDALDLALILATRFDVEVWDLDRMVGRVAASIDRSVVNRAGHDPYQASPRARRAPASL